MFALRIAPVWRAVAPRGARRVVVRRAAHTAASADASPEETTETPPKPKKEIPPPFFLSPPPPPPSPECWQNMVLLMDKPKGWTSFDVVGKTRSMTRKFGVKKVGHCGTLDPDATGLLILCIGKATKLVDNFVGMDKVYTGVMRLGEATPSQDAATPVETFSQWEHVTDAQLADAARSFVGEITQIPPMYSAIKVGGERLYKAARRGEVVERKERKVVVSSFTVERDLGDAQFVKFKVECSKGTYIRTLAHDLGAALGSAAHLTALRRESIGEHLVGDAWTTGALFEACGPQLLEFQRVTKEELAAKELATAEAEAIETESDEKNHDEKTLSDDDTSSSDSESESEFVQLPGYETGVRTVTPAPDQSGKEVKKGSAVTVHALGVVVETGEKFWSTKDPGQQPFAYNAGIGQVITGWDQAVMGMRVGEVREARIPAKEGYGEGGFPTWGIPPGGTLLFTIEVLVIEGE